MSTLQEIWDGWVGTTARTTNNYNSGYVDDETWLWIGIIAGGSVGGLLVLVMLVCMIRGCCNIAIKQNCPLLCRTCQRSCRSQCGTADVCQEEAILRPYEGILENDKLWEKGVAENRILEAVVREINKARPWLQMETKNVGSLKERLGKPTRVITNDYPSGLPGRSPLCTDIDVMMISKAPHMIATHYNNAIDRLIIIPSPSNIGYVKVMIPLGLYNDKKHRFLQSLSGREDYTDPPQSYYFLSADLIKESLGTSLRKLDVPKLVKKTKAKLENHKRALRVESAGPAVKVVIRQQMSSCTRCCMLGQCSLRLCCCMANCLMEEELDVLFEGDFTFALRVCEWPVVANEWVTRSRVWPNAQVIKTILDEGCAALVPKSEWGDGLLWRYSFSEAEIHMMISVPPATYKAMLAIKSLLKRVGCPLKSYWLKSMLFWCLETPSDSFEFWSDLNNLPGIFTHLLNEFLAMIKEGRCRHYFIRDINLLEQANNIPSIVESLERLVVDPYSHLTTRALEKSRCCAMSSLICRLLCGCHDTELTLDVY